MNDNRLSCMEEKLDKLSEAIICVARIEERMISVFKRLDRVDEVFISQTSAWMSWNKPASNGAKP